MLVLLFHTCFLFCGEEAEDESGLFWVGRGMCMRSGGGGAQRGDGQSAPVKEGGRLRGGGPEGRWAKPVNFSEMLLQSKACIRGGCDSCIKG